MITLIRWKSRNINSGVYFLDFEIEGTYYFIEENGTLIETDKLAEMFEYI